MDGQRCSTDGIERTEGDALQTQCGRSTAPVQVDRELSQTLAKARPMATASLIGARAQRHVILWTPCSCGGVPRKRRYQCPVHQTVIEMKTSVAP